MTKANGDAGHGVRHFEADKGNRIVRIRFLFYLHTLWRNLHAGMVMEAQNYLAVFGNHVGQRDSPPVGVKPLGLPFENERMRLQGKEYTGRSIVYGSKRLSPIPSAETGDRCG